MADQSKSSTLRDTLTCLLHRLEAATSRLEDMASSTIPPLTANGTAATSAILPPPPPPLPVQEPPKPQEPVPELVEDFDAFIKNSVKKYVALSDAIGGPIAEQVGIVDRCIPRQKQTD
jgi:adenylyl cyclase-associated protein